VATEVTPPWFLEKQPSPSFSSSSSSSSLYTRFLVFFFDHLMRASVRRFGPIGREERGRERERESFFVFVFVEVDFFIFRFVF